MRWENAQKTALIAADGSKDSMSGSYQGILLGDIVATNARFAVLVDNEFGPVRSMQVVADHERFADAISAFLHAHCPEDGITRAAFALDGPVADGRCKLTGTSKNSHSARPVGVSGIRIWLRSSAV
jgi:glucokinase